MKPTRNRLFRSLQSQFLLTLVVSGILPLGLAGTLLIVLYQQTLATQSVRELTGLARGLSAEMNLYIDGRLSDSRVIAALPGLLDISAPEQSQLLQTIFLEFTDFGLLAISDTSGQLVASSQPDLAPPSGAAFASAAQRGQQAWEVTPPHDGRRQLLIFTPIRDDDRNVRGVLQSVVDLDTITSVITGVVVGSGGHAFVVDRNGQALLHPAAEVMRQPDQYVWPALATGAPQPGPGTFEYTWQGLPFIAAFAPVPDFGWTVVVEQPKDEVLAPVRQAGLIGGSALLLSVVLALAAAFLSVRQLTSPLRQLAHAADAFAAGDARVPLPRSRIGAAEVEVLVDAFSTMRATVSAALERERAEQALSAAILAGVPTGLLVLGHDLRVRSANRAIAELLGRPSADLSGHALDQLWPDAELHERALATLAADTPQNQFIFERGEPIQLFRVFLNRIHDAAGARLLIGIEDLTELTQIKLRYRALETLQIINRKILGATDLNLALQEILDLTRTIDTFDFGLIWLRGASSELQAVAEYGRLDRASLIAEQMQIEHLAGGAAAHVLGAGEIAACPHLRGEGLHAAVLVPIQTEQQWLGAIELGVRAERSFSAPELELLTAIGSQVGLAVQKGRLDDALRASEAEARMLSLVASRTDNAVIISNAQAEIEWVNASFTRITGYTLGEVRGLRAGRVLQGPLSDPETIAYMRGQLARGAAFQVEIVNYRKSGEPYWNAIEVQPIYDQSGVVVSYMALESDISARKRAEAQLRAAKDEAVLANSAKSEFLSRMSHELRTPLHAILGFAQILEMEALARSQIESVQQILRAGRHLLDLINEVLDITSIEAGRLSFSPEPVQLRAVLHEAADLVRALADQHENTIEIADTPASYEYAKVDRQRLKQVLVNLLTNAVKYNRRGGRVSLAVVLAGADTVRINVGDTGPGIALEQQARLFTPFDRLGADRLGVEGTGLGLALSKRLVELMSGRIGVESELGVGSVFWLELLRTSRPELDLSALPASAPSPALPGRPPVTLLYIEDNSSNLLLIEQVLQRQSGWRLLSSQLGRTGLALAQQQRPDLILLDLNLPDIDGAGVLAALRELPETRAIPVVVLSADATDSRIEQLKAQGARAYLTKPINIRVFLKTLEQLIDERPT